MHTVVDGWRVVRSGALVEIEPLQRARNPRVALFVDDFDLDAHALPFEREAVAREIVAEPVGDALDLQPAKIDGIGSISMRSPKTCGPPLQHLHGGSLGSPLKSLTTPST
jgi:hypothetical protein